jgi:hypothetical protein
VSYARAVDVLVPTRRRHPVLAVTLSGLAAQPDVRRPARPRRHRAAAGGDDRAAHYWAQLPPWHRGEDVVTQLRVIERSGGVGVLPSGAWHAELPTQVADRTVDAYTAVLEADDRGAA